MPERQDTKDRLLNSIRTVKTGRQTRKPKTTQAAKAAMTKPEQASLPKSSRFTIGQRVWPD